MLILHCGRVTRRKGDEGTQRCEGEICEGGLLGPEGGVAPWRGRVGGRHRRGVGPRGRGGGLPWRGPRPTWQRPKGRANDRPPGPGDSADGD